MGLLALTRAIAAHDARVREALARCARDIAESTTVVTAELERAFAQPWGPPRESADPAAASAPSAPQVGAEPLRGFVRGQDLRARVFGNSISRATLYRWRQDPALRFPAPIRVQGVALYDAAAVLEWLRGRQERR